MKKLLLVAGCWLLASVASSNQQPATGNLCDGTDYQRALCAYRAADFATAEQLFRRVAEAVEKEPQTIKARYFLGRTLMRQRRWAAASEEFIRIYGLDRAFYDEWNCDFLLGECRRAQGLD